MWVPWRSNPPLDILYCMAPSKLGPESYRFRVVGTEEETIAIIEMSFSSPFFQCTFDPSPEQHLHLDLSDD